MTYAATTATDRQGVPKKTTECRILKICSFLSNCRQTSFPFKAFFSQIIFLAWRICDLVTWISVLWRELVCIAFIKQKIYPYATVSDETQKVLNINKQRKFVNIFHHSHTICKKTMCWFKSTNIFWLCKNINNLHVVVVKRGQSISNKNNTRERRHEGEGA